LDRVLDSESSIEEGDDRGNELILDVGLECTGSRVKEVIVSDDSHVGVVFRLEESAFLCRSHIFIDFEMINFIVFIVMVAGMFNQGIDGYKAGECQGKEQ
jgi:hypothetical protein